MHSLPLYTLIIGDELAAEVTTAPAGKG
jgi:hypothetical protein